MHGQVFFLLKWSMYVYTNTQQCVDLRIIIENLFDVFTAITIAIYNNYL